MKPLTAKQKLVLKFIKAFLNDNHYPPTIREIAADRSVFPRAIVEHLEALEKKGYIERKRRVSRGIKLINELKGQLK